MALTYYLLKLTSDGQLDKADCAEGRASPDRLILAAMAVHSLSMDGRGIAHRGITPKKLPGSQTALACRNFHFAF
jgi:hypothetical protein